MSDREDSQAERSVAWTWMATRILTPLAGAFLDQGLGYRELERAVCAAFRRAARQRGVRDAAAVRARTGLPARDGRVESMPAPPLSYRDATRLISRWTSEPELSKDGRPRILRLRGERSFATLCAMCDLPATPTLDALRESGVVRVRRSNVSLIDAAYVPRSGLRERLDIMARDAAEVIRLLVHNVTAGRGRRMLQRKASYDNIGARSLPRLRPVLEEHAMHALYAADRALAETDRDRRPDAAGGRRSRVAFGVYVLEEPADTESEQEEPS